MPQVETPNPKPQIRNPTHQTQNQSGVEGAGLPQGWLGRSEREKERAREREREGGGWGGGGPRTDPQTRILNREPSTLTPAAERGGDNL